MRTDASSPRLTAGPVGLHLRALAVPMAWGFVALNSYSIADTYFVGRLGTLPLAAMGFTFPITFAMVAAGLGVGIGTSSVIARLREAFPDLPNAPGPREVFLKLRELRNTW